MHKPSTSPQNIYYRRVIPPPPTLNKFLRNWATMATSKTVPGGLEWRVTVPKGSTVQLEPETGPTQRAWLGLIHLVMVMRSRVENFGKMVWRLGVDDPRKPVHGIKVGIALALVSLFYYTRPLYDGVGGSAMWAVMTVVVIFEFTIGGTLYKGVNRCIATFTAGALAIGIHWIACKSGETMEPIVRSAAVFILASAATFSRFIPTVKIWFDYGITIFILTFSLVAVSGYRVDKLLELAEQRLSTIAIGICICFLVSILVFPVWAGNDLHLLITRNMDKLADSLDGCVYEYFKTDRVSDKKETASQKKSQGYKCVLNSKSSEDSLATLAKWEPAHGRFSFRHPWTKYQKIGAAMRCCAYCIEALNGCINSEIQVPELIKKHLNDACIKLSSECSKVLKESISSIISMQRSGRIDFFVCEMNSAVRDIHMLLTNPPADIPMTEALPLITFGSLLIEITKRVEGVVEAADKLATAANFKPANDEKPEKTEVVHDQDIEMMVK